jgi:hypothetical protein
MKYIEIIIAVVIALNIFSCKDGPIPEDGEYQGCFAWEGLIKGVGNSDYWTISCTGGCDTCYAYQSPSSDGVMLNKNKHGKIFDYCLTLPAAPIEEDPEDDDTVVVVPTGEVVFQGDDSLFGTDLWRTCRTGFVEEINYRSIAAGGKAYIKIELTEGILKAYKKVVVVLDEPAAQNYVSFYMASNKDTLNLYHTSNTPYIYTDSAAPDGAVIEVKVLGIADSKQPACLAGDCYGSSDRMQIVLYNKRTFNNYPLYTHPGYSQSDSQFKAGFNGVLQQAVLEMGNQVRKEIADSIWDLNENGFLDFFPGYAVDSSIGGVFYNEYFPLLMDAKQYLVNKCYDINSNLTGASFLINAPIRQNWILIEDPIPDSDGRVRNLKLGSIAGLELGDTLTIGPYLSASNHFKITLLIADPATNIAKIGLSDSLMQGLPNIFKADSSITLYTIVNGVTIDNCSCSKSNKGYGTHAHEFLHQNIVGPLEHVVEKDNIMYLDEIERTGVRLRYRELETGLSSKPCQKQWDELH